MVCHIHESSISICLTGAVCRVGAILLIIILVIIIIAVGLVFSLGLSRSYRFLHREIQEGDH